MISIDELRDKHSKRQKYLLLRVITIFLLIVFGLNTIYYTPNISPIIFFNTLILLFLPLFVEYFIGMDTYSSYTNTFRWIGFIISLLFLGMCVLGFMGNGVLNLSDKEKLVQEVVILNFFTLKISVLKVLTYIMMGNCLLDYVFTFNDRELHYYKALKGFEENFNKKYEVIKKVETLEKRTLRYKMLFWSPTGKTIGKS